MQEVYSESEIETIRNNEPNKFSIWEKYSDAGFQIYKSTIQSDKYKEVDFVLLADKKTKLEISTFTAQLEKGEVNPLKYYWRPGNERQLFHLKDTDIFLVIPSISDLK